MTEIQKKIRTTSNQVSNDVSKALYEVYKMGRNDGFTDGKKHDKQIRTDERAKVIENYCWLKCKCNGNGCVGTPDECFVVTTLKCDRLTRVEKDV